MEANSMNNENISIENSNSINQEYINENIEFNSSTENQNSSNSTKRINELKLELQRLRNEGLNEFQKAKNEISNVYELIKALPSPIENIQSSNLINNTSINKELSNNQKIKNHNDEQTNYSLINSKKQNLIHREINSIENENKIQKLSHPIETANTLPEEEILLHKLNFNPNLNPNLRIKIYVRIEGLSPFVLYPSGSSRKDAASFYRCHHHIKMIEAYVSNLIPDEELLLRRRVYFYNHLNMSMENKFSFINKHISSIYNEKDQKKSIISNSNLMDDYYSLDNNSKLNQYNHSNYPKNIQSLMKQFFKEIKDSYEIRSDFSETDWWDNDTFFEKSNVVNIKNKTKSLEGNPSHVFMYEFRRSSVRMEYSIEVQQKIHVYYWILDSNQISWINDVKSENNNYQLTKDFGTPRLITLNRLFQFIFLEEFSPRSIHSRVFLKTFTMFFNHHVFIQKIEESWECPDIADWLMRSNPLFCSGNMSDVERESLKSFHVSQLDIMYHRTSIIPRIRLRILQILYIWIEEDVSNMFENINEITKIQTLINKLNIYTEKDIERNNARPYLSLLNKITILLKNIQPPAWKRKPKTIFSILFPDTPPPAVSKLQILINHTPKEIAENLTIVDYLIYNRIESFELLNQRWVKEKWKHQAVNINASIKFVNRIGAIVSQSILIQPDDRKRKRIIKKWLFVLSELIQLNSFNMMMSVSSALGNSSIFRLKAAWSLVKEKNLIPLNKAKQLSSPDGNYKNFRKLLADLYEQEKPVSPYIGFKLKDIILCDEGSPSFVDGKINFSKAMKMWELISSVLQFKSEHEENRGRFSFIKPIPEIVQLIENWKCLSEDALYQLSLEAEPRK